MPKDKALNYNRAEYKAALDKFDSAICEAIAVSQASSGRYSAPNIGYASHVFTQMCGAGVSMIRATPLSRWVRSDFEDWRFGAVAGHIRSLVDGFLLFNYLIKPTSCQDELNARMNVMHLNDCTRRIQLFTKMGLKTEQEGFEQQLQDLRGRLELNEYFKALPLPTQRACLNGKFLMIESRDEMLIKVGFKKGMFDTLYDLWSQHIHILPLSFYRTEPNGRGTGLENDADRSYISHSLEIGTAVLIDSTNMLVDNFPDVAHVRQGVKSTFSPGPKKNLPRKRNHTKSAIAPTLAKSPLSMAVQKM